MPTYEFICENCPVARRAMKEAGKVTQITKDTIPVCHQEHMIPMSEAPATGATMPCPAEGCSGKLLRVMSVPEFCIKQPFANHIGANDAVRTRVGDQDVNIRFVDHPHTMPGHEQRINKLAQMSGITRQGLSQGYYSPQHKRFVVDVASNVPDPLGMIQRQKQAGNFDYKKIGVGQSYRQRAKGKKKP